MIITVLSDTHMDYPDAVLEHIFTTYCVSAEMVLHCGDMVSEPVWNFFMPIQNFLQSRAIATQVRCAEPCPWCVT